MYSFLIALSFIILTFVTVNTQRILLWLNELLFSFDIEVAALTKTINFIERKGLFLGILNGRDLVYARGYELFKESPIYGNGIGVYADKYDGSYPHNLFIQLLAEGGIILTVPFIIIFLINLWYLIKPWINKDKIYEIRLYILFLFIICIPRLMFSSYFWREEAFWLLIFVLFSMLSNKKGNSHQPNYIELRSDGILTESGYRLHESKM